MRWCRHIWTKRGCRHNWGLRGRGRGIHYIVEDIIKLEETTGLGPTCRRRGHVKGRSRRSSFALALHHPHGFHHIVVSLAPFTPFASFTALASHHPHGFHHIVVSLAPFASFIPFAALATHHHPTSDKPLPVSSATLSLSRVASVPTIIEIILAPTCDRVTLVRVMISASSMTLSILCARRAQETPVSVG